MAVHQPVGSNVAVTLSSTSAQSTSLPQQSDTIRIVNHSGHGCHVAIGSTPVATSANYFVEKHSEANLNLGQASSTRIVEVHKSSAAAIATTCFFPQGTIGATFQVGDTVALTGKSGWEFQHHPISAITFPAARGSGGSEARVKIEVDFNSSGWSGSWTDDDSGAGDKGVLRKTFQVAGIMTGSQTGKLHVQQIQITGDA